MTPQDHMDKPVSSAEIRHTLTKLIELMAEAVVEQLQEQSFQTHQTDNARKENDVPSAERT